MKKFLSPSKIALMIALVIVAVTGILVSFGSTPEPEKCLKMRLFYRVTTHTDGTYDAVLDSMCSISAKGGEITAMQL